MDDDGNDNLTFSGDERVGDILRSERPKLKSLPPDPKRRKLPSRREEILRLAHEAMAEIDPAADSRRSQIVKLLHEARATGKQPKKQPKTSDVTINFSGPITIVFGDLKG
jgi:hypothetical protein